MGFDPVKLKLQLKLVITRLQMLQKKRENMGLTDRRQIADLLKRKKDELARIKVEQVIRDDYLVEAMEIMEMYCTLLSTRFGLIESVKHCDPGIQEAVCTIIWASNVLQGDVPELKQISQQLHAKYGKEISLPGYEETIVNEKVKHKLSIHQPPPTLVEAYLVTIAEKYGVPFTPNTSVGEKPQMVKPQPDMPDGHAMLPAPPNGFGGAGGDHGGANGGGGSGGMSLLLPQVPGSGSNMSDFSGNGGMGYNPAYPPQQGGFGQGGVYPPQQPQQLYPPQQPQQQQQQQPGYPPMQANPTPPGYTAGGYPGNGSAAFDPYPVKSGSHSWDAELPLPPSSRPAMPSAPNSAPAEAEFGFPMPPSAPAGGVLPAVPGGSTSNSLNYDDLTERFNALRKR